MTGVVHLISKRYGLVFALLLITALALAAPVTALDHILVPGDSIQQNITAAADGDTLILMPGTYNQSGMTVTGKNITIRAADGHGPLDTILDAGFADRLFMVTGVTSRLAVRNLTLRNGRPLVSGGGCISLYDGNLSIASSTISGCQGGETMLESVAGGGGGALSASGGTVTVTSSTITGCRAGDSLVSGGDGGAIDAWGTHLTITSSAITGCRAGDVKAPFPGSGNVPGNGGAISAHGSSHVVITSSTLSGNRAGIALLAEELQGHGNGIFSRAESFTISHCRITGNENDDITTSGGGTFTATDNWWGTSSNPSSRITGSVSSDPWLVLGITASPASITTTGTSAIRANLTYDNTGAPAAGGTFGPDGTLIHFTATGGTVSPAYVGTENGIATTTFTPAGAGTGTVSATVEGETVSTGVMVTEGTIPSSKIGVYRDGAWYLDYLGEGQWTANTRTYSFGATGFIPVVGDWNGDGRTKVGVYKDGAWYLDYLGEGQWTSNTKAYSFGTAGYTPMVGDWNGDGRTKIGVYKDGAWYLDYLGEGQWTANTKAYSFGETGFIPVVGNWS